MAGSPSAPRRWSWPGRGAIIGGVVAIGLLALWIAVDRDGYLRPLGFIALSDAQRRRSAAFATSMTPMTSAGLK